MILTNTPRFYANTKENQFGFITQNLTLRKLMINCEPTRPRLPVGRTNTERVTGSPLKAYTTTRAGVLALKYGYHTKRAAKVREMLIDIRAYILLRFMIFVTFSVVVFQGY